MITLNAVNTKIASVRKAAGSLRSDIADLSRDTLILVYGVQDEATTGTVDPINKLISALDGLPAMKKEVISFFREHLAFKFDSVSNTFGKKNRKVWTEKRQLVVELLANEAWDIFHQAEKEPKPKATPAEKVTKSIQSAIKAGISVDDLIDAVLAAGVAREQLVASIHRRREARRPSHDELGNPIEQQAE